MLDLVLQELKEKISKEASESGLPASILAYMFSDFTIQCNNLAQQQIQIQKQQREQNNKGEQEICK
jgi:hypothetical protein